MSIASGPRRSITRARLALRSSVSSLPDAVPGADSTAATIAAATARMISDRSRRSDRNELPGVHAVVRIERALDGAHQFEGRAVLGLHVLQLADADPVLARAGAAEPERAH